MNALCRLQLTKSVSIDRVATGLRARPLMTFTSISEIFDAHAAVFFTPSSSTSQIRRKSPPAPVQHFWRNSAPSWWPASTISPASPSIKAASVLGRTGNHSAGTIGRSSRTGPRQNKFHTSCHHETEDGFQACVWRCLLLRSTCSSRESPPKTTTVSANCDAIQRACTTRARLLITKHMAQNHWPCRNAVGVHMAVCHQPMRASVLTAMLRGESVHN